MNMRSATSIGELLPSYDTFILDLWGVVHDGSQLYPGALNTLKQLKAANKKAIFLSNAPRGAKVVKTALDRLGISRDLYVDVVSSGQVGIDWLASGKSGMGTRYFFMGETKDERVLEGLSFERVTDIGKADFILNVGELDEDTTVRNKLSRKQSLKLAKEKDLPMLCLNPDLQIVKISGEVIPCAGALAADYEKLGGEVRYFGKPYPEVYARCLEILGNPEKSRVLAVGDSLETDIPGAINAGIDSLLVTGGIYRNDLAAIDTLCAERGLCPTYRMPSLSSNVMGTQR